MEKTKKILTPAQKKANARNQLFRQIHGFCLEPFIMRAIAEQAITIDEEEIIRQILIRLKLLKHNQFENSKKVGLNAKRRCSFCNSIARYKTYIFINERYLCNKHKLEFENDPDIESSDFIKINPNE